MTCRRGLYYLNARYYNPVTRRFLSEDPVGPNASNPLSYNEYAYAENNPVNRVDPSGEFSWRWINNKVNQLNGWIPPMDDPVAIGVDTAEDIETGTVDAVDGIEALTEGTGEASAGLRGKVKARGLPTDGRFHFVPDGNKIEFNRSNGGYVDRYGNVWVKGPYHGDPKLGFTYEWDVQLSASGKNAWGKFANGKGYINVRPDGGLSH